MMGENRLDLNAGKVENSNQATFSGFDLLREFKQSQNTGSTIQTVQEAAVNLGRTALSDILPNLTISFDPSANLNEQGFKKLPTSGTNKELGGKQLAGKEFAGKELAGKEGAGKESARRLAELLSAPERAARAALADLSAPERAARAALGIPLKEQQHDSRVGEQPRQRLGRGGAADCHNGTRNVPRGEQPQQTRPRGDGPGPGHQHPRGDEQPQQTRPRGDGPGPGHQHPRGDETPQQTRPRGDGPGPGHQHPRGDETPQQTRPRGDGPGPGNQRPRGDETPQQTRPRGDGPDPGHQHPGDEDMPQQPNPREDGPRDPRDRRPPGGDGPRNPRDRQPPGGDGTRDTPPRTRPLEGPRIEVQNRGATPEFQAQVQAQVDALPPGVRRLLETNRTNIVIGDTVTQVRPELAGERPRGWPPGSTWNNADGLYTDRMVVVTENRVVDGNRERNNRAEGVLNHEVGHAVDDALGNFSSSAEFMAAYERDVANLSAADRAELAYLLQPNGAGRSETFAEVFGALNGSAANPHETQARLRQFPMVADLMRRRLAQL